MTNNTVDLFVKEINKCYEIDDANTIAGLDLVWYQLLAGCC